MQALDTSTPALRATTGAFKDSVALVVHYNGFSAIERALQSLNFHRELAEASRKAGKIHLIIMLPDGFATKEQVERVGDYAFEDLCSVLRPLTQVIWVKRMDSFQVVFSRNNRFQKGSQVSLYEYRRLESVE